MDFNKNEIDMFEEARKFSGAHTLTETIRRAIRVYNFILKHLTDGSELLLRRPDGKEEKIHLL